MSNIIVLRFNDGASLSDDEYAYITQAAEYYVNGLIELDLELGDFVEAFLEKE